MEIFIKIVNVPLWNPCANFTCSTWPFTPPLIVMTAILPTRQTRHLLPLDLLVWIPHWTTSFPSVTSPDHKDRSKAPENKRSQPLSGLRMRLRIQCSSPSPRYTSITPPPGGIFTHLLGGVWGFLIGFPGFARVLWGNYGNPNSTGPLWYCYF